MKALIFVLLYCRIGSEEGKTDPRTRVKEKVKVYVCRLLASLSMLVQTKCWDTGMYARHQAVA